MLCFLLKILHVMPEYLKRFLEGRKVSCLKSDYLKQPTFNALGAGCAGRELERSSDVLGSWGPSTSRPAVPAAPWQGAPPTLGVQL